MGRVGNAWAPCLRGFFQPRNSGCVCRGGHPLPLITCAPQSLILGKTTGKTGIHGNGVMVVAKAQQFLEQLEAEL